MRAAIAKGTNLPVVVPQNQNRMARDLEHRPIAGTRDVLRKTGDDRQFLK